MVEGKRARRILWLGALAAMAAGCPGPRAPAERTVVTASGEVPYPTDFTPPPPLGPPPAADPRALGARYLDLVHRRIGEGWTAFLEDCRLRLPPSHPLNSPTLVATAGLTVDVQGNVLEVTLLRPSGNPDFDDVVRAVATDAGPLPPPERALLSDDDRVYLTWSFARDERQAGAATASLRRIEWSLDRAVPRFLAERNLAEAARAGRGCRSCASGAARDQVLELGERVMAAAVRFRPGRQRASACSGHHRRRRGRAPGPGGARAALDRRRRAHHVGQARRRSRRWRRSATATRRRCWSRSSSATRAPTSSSLARACGRLDRLGQRERRRPALSPAGSTPAGRARLTAVDRARRGRRLIAAGQAPVPAAIPDITRACRPRPSRWCAPRRAAPWGRGGGRQAGGPWLRSTRPATPTRRCARRASALSPPRPGLARRTARLPLAAHPQAWAIATSACARPPSWPWSARAGPRRRRAGRRQPRPQPGGARQPG
ncbi:MAG: TonB C-terminal domain-containing protein [Kofleriaceae bacterium]|nr:TonB C-terminal domain-containing protein [Kofleriaceae bacterium]